MTAWKGRKSHKGDIWPCWPIVQSDNPVAPADGLMRGMCGLSYSPQSTHSRHSDRRQLWTKNTEEERSAEERRDEIVNALHAKTI